jgi:CheY-like chemotaxis protein
VSTHHATDAAPLTMLAVGLGALVSRMTHLVAGLPPSIVGPLTTLLGGALLHLAAPYLRARGERLRDRALRRRPVAALTRSVLVIEDHSSGEILAGVLREALDVPVYLARSGAEGRGMAQRYSPAAIVCDLALPDEDGDDVLRAIGLRGALLVSGAAHPADITAAAERCGATPMQKPLDPGAVIAAVRGMLAGAV